MSSKHNSVWQWILSRPQGATFTITDIVGACSVEAANAQKLVMSAVTARAAEPVYRLGTDRRVEGFDNNWTTQLSQLGREFKLDDGSLFDGRDPANIIVGFVRLITPIVHNKYHNTAPSDAVYIGRPSKWGNPFSHKDGTLAKFKVSSREEAVSRYEEWFVSQPELVEMARKELAGKDLVCWCAPAACHGNVLIRIANHTGA